MSSPLADRGQSAAGTRSWAIDLFAGPGGWDIGLRQSHGVDPLGIEWDDAACATRAAAGLPTIQADVAEMDPLAGDLLIASPPCQAFSVAGKGWGLFDMDKIVRCLHELVAGQDTRAQWQATCKDKRSLLIVEPMRWALANDFEWIVLEQVPAALGLWNVYAELLREMSYSVWTGVLEAERYGVPQTRERAVLMASRWDAVHPPAPTHQRYVYGEPARHELTFDGELLPWVSMADALGWAGRKLNPSNGRERTDGGGPVPRDDDQPAPTVTSEIGGQWKWVQRERSGDRSEEGFDPHAEPCQTLTSKARSWTLHRPATTIACDPRVFQPGGHHEPGQQSENAIRLTPSEAGVLQSFPADYPWQGSRTKQFEQIGNAFPPLLAASVLRAAIPSAKEIAA